MVATGVENTVRITDLLKVVTLRGALRNFRGVFSFAVEARSPVPASEEVSACSDGGTALTHFLAYLFEG